MNNSVLLVTHVALRDFGGTLHIDDQTYAGLQHWCSEFDKVTYVGLEDHGDGASSVSWTSLAPLVASGKLDVRAFPVGYSFGGHLRHAGRIRREFRDLIPRHACLCFSLGSVLGDWGAVAAREADAQKRKFAVWFDRVEHLVTKATLPAMPWKRRLKSRALIEPTRLYHEHLVRRASVGIFQGRDCFDFYRHNSADPQLVYDTHTQEHHLISDTELETKLARVREGAPLRLIYAGRAAPMKGPEDWIATLAELRRAGVTFEATWLGDGPSLPAMQAAITAARIEGSVRLAGHVSDREALLKSMRESDMFLYCHKTPESPRCLIEALVSGLPLVGYASAYVEGLLEGYEAGRLAPIGEWARLAREIQALDADREKLASLIRQAATSGRRFDEARIYRDRANLLRRTLGFQEPRHTLPGAGSQPARDAA